MSEPRVAVDVMVNGHRHHLDVPARRTLADALREELHLTGTHLGCEHGVCGACTVLLDGEAVRACLVFAAQADGCEITTVEGLAEDDEFAPLQVAFSQQRALQCGFCTPGFLMLAEDHLRHSREDDEERVRAHLSANLCRCTGYSGLVDAVRDTVRSSRSPDGDAPTG